MLRCCHFHVFMSVILGQCASSADIPLRSETGEFRLNLHGLIRRGWGGSISFTIERWVTYIIVIVLPLCMQCSSLYRAKLSSARNVMQVDLTSHSYVRSQVLEREVVFFTIVARVHVDQ
jgi:hypothetical protein